MKRSKKIRERILAAVLAAVLAAGMLPQNVLVASAASGDPLKMEIKIEDSYDDGALKQFDLKIERTDTQSADIMLDETDIDQTENKYLVDLVEDGEYAYTATAEGYEEKTGTFKVTANSDPVTIKMDLSDIEVSKSSLDMKVGASETVSIANPVAGASYSWSAEDGTVASVNAGTVVAAKEGQTNIVISYKNKETKIPVTVKRYDTSVELAVSPENGKDVTSVTLTATVKENGSSISGSSLGTVEFKLGDTVLGSSAVNNGQAVYVYTPSGYMSGEVGFTATYSGNDKYTSSAQTVNKTYASDDPIQISSKDVVDGKIVYDSNGTEFQLEVTGDQGRAISYKSNDEEVAEVDATGKVTVKKPGDISIEVTAAGTADYNTSEVTFSAVAQQALTAADLEWQDAEKIYDGSPVITVKAKVAASKQIGDKEVTYIFSAQLTGENAADVGSSKKDAEITELSSTEGEADYYSLDTDSLKNEKVQGKATVTARKVTLGISEDQELTYGVSLTDEIAEIDGLVTVEEEGDTTGLLKADSDKYKFTATLATPVSGDPYYVGTYADAVIPGQVMKDNEAAVSIGENGTTVGNYQFVPDKNSYKTLTVTRQKLNDADIQKAVKWVAADNTTLGEKTGDTWKIYAKNKSVLQLQVDQASAFKDYYDTVLIQLPGESAYNNASQGITLSDNMSEGVLSGVKISLANSNQADTYTESSNGGQGNAFDSIYIDNSAPSVELSDLSATASSALTDAITFGFFRNSAYTADVTVKDQPETDNAGYDNGAEYYVWYLKGNDDETKYEAVKGTDLSADAVKEKIGKIEDGGEWEKVENNKIPVTGDKGDIEQGYYLMFVKVSDRIGNGGIYVSNGMVFETEAPSVAVTGITDGSIYGEDDEDQTNGGVPYSITVTEPKDAYISGIGRLEVSVTKQVGSESVTAQPGNAIKYTETQTEPYKDSYVIDFKQESYKLDELEKWTQKTVDGIVTAEDGKTTHITLEVKAYDNAGNYDETLSVTKTFQIDKEAPQIEVSYDNNSVANDKYFKAGREMTIQYTEDNLDTSSLQFDLSLGGAAQGKKSLDELLAYSLPDGYVIERVSGTEDAPLEESENADGEKVYTLKLRFDHNKDLSDDAEYSIVPSCTDEAKNPNAPVTYADGTEAGESFVIDKKAPALQEVTYKNSDGEFYPKDKELSGEEKAYSTSAVEMVVAIEEKNFWLENPDSGEKEFSDKQFDFAGTQGKDIDSTSVIEESEYNDAANGAGNWTSQGYVRTSGEGKLAFSKEANYTVTFKYTDLAGNELVYTPQYFTVDGSAPSGNISTAGININNVNVTTFFDVITFNIFNRGKDIELTGEDKTSGVKSIEYVTYDHVNEKPENENAVKAALESDKVRSVTLSPVSVGSMSQVRGSFPVEANEQLAVYTKITDYAGNVAYVYPERGVVSDKTGPEITVNCTNANAARNDIFNEDVHFSVSVQDKVAGDTYSGIKRVWYTIESTSNVKNQESANLFVEEAAVPEKNQDTRSGSFTVDADKFNSNDVMVRVYAEDLSGNIESKEIKLKIDTTDPTIDVTYDLNSPLNERYYNQTRTATVTVTERNFDPSGVRFNITNTDGTQPSISGWSHSAGAGVSDSATHTCTVTFAADGDYTFTLNATDLAGNDSSYTRVDDFTIDQTDPTIEVSYDNNNDAEPGYFNADRTATVRVTEHNFNAADVNAAITASLVGSGVSAPGLGGWSTSGDVHTASVTFSADADYTFDIDYTDLAGNAAADYTQDSFTIDQTAPELEIFDIEDKSANNDVVAPGVRYSDNNYTENGVEITLKGVYHSAISMDGDRTSIPNGESIKMADFERTKETDDLYTLTAVITDRAGNETEDSVLFSVNRFGSVYVLSDETEKLLYGYYINEEQDLVVQEINVDSLVFNGISYGRDGELVSLEAGEDYEVKASGSEVSWKQYDYTIYKENFEKEGNYTVTIDSEDRATNTGNSKVNGCDIEFAIDKTAPTVVITGIEEGEQYRANTRDITVNAADNLAMGKVDVYVGSADKPANTYDDEAIRNAGGELVYTMSSDTSRQDIKAVATDAAGNTAEAEITGVLLTSNLFVQFYSNTPLLIGTIAGVAVIAGGLLWFFLIFRRKKEEQAN